MSNGLIQDLKNAPRRLAFAQCKLVRCLQTVSSTRTWLTGHPHCGSGLTVDSDSAGIKSRQLGHLLRQTAQSLCAWVSTDKAATATVPI